VLTLALQGMDGIVKAQSDLKPAVLSPGSLIMRNNIRSICVGLTVSFAIPTISEADQFIIEPWYNGCVIANQECVYQAYYLNVKTGTVYNCVAIFHLKNISDSGLYCTDLKIPVSGVTAIKPGYTFNPLAPTPYVGNTQAPDVTYVQWVQDGSGGLWICRKNDSTNPPMCIKPRFN
jgi:hypothetical protein